MGQAQPKHKGKISRVLAAKCALSIRVDALGDTSQATVGFDARLKVEERMRQLEGRLPGEVESHGSAGANERGKIGGVAVQYHDETGKGRGYNPAADSTVSANGADDEAARKAAKKAAKAAAKAAAAAGGAVDDEAARKAAKKEAKRAAAAAAGEG